MTHLLYQVFPQRLLATPSEVLTPFKTSMFHTKGILILSLLKYSS